MTPPRNQNIKAYSTAGVDDWRRIKFISVLVLIGSFPLSSGLILHSAWLSWTGVAIVGVAVLCFAVEGMRGVWWYLHLPKCRVAKTDSKAVADEYLRLGWTLKHVYTDSGNEKFPVFLLVQ